LNRSTLKWRSLLLRRTLHRRSSLNWLTLHWGSLLPLEITSLWVACSWRIYTSMWSSRKSSTSYRLLNLSIGSENRGSYWTSRNLSSLILHVHKIEKSHHSLLHFLVLQIFLWFLSLCFRNPPVNAHLITVGEWVVDASI
jgi:hypothetical protein